MKPTYLIPLVLALEVLSSSPARAELPFQAGDRFTYSLNWSVIKVGKAVLEFKKSPIEEGGPDYLHTVFTVETSGIADKVFKVRDRIDSWVEPETGRPILYKKKQREGKTKRDIEIHFDWEKMEARYFRDGTERDPIEIEENTYDPLSLILKVLGTNFDDGASHSFGATDGKAIVLIDVSHEKDRRVRTSAGRFKTKQLEVATKELEGVFEKSPDASIHVWLSSEGDPIPVRLKSEVVVGSFRGDLVEITRAEKQAVSAQ